MKRLQIALILLLACPNDSWAEKLKLDWEISLGDLGDQRVITPAICPDGVILSVVPGARVSWISPEGKLLAQYQDPFGAATQSVLCVEKQVIALGSGFWARFRRSGSDLVLEQKEKTPYVLRNAIARGGKILASGARGNEILLLNLKDDGSEVSVLRTQKVTQDDNRKHENGELDAQMCFALKSSDVIRMSPITLGFERLDFSTGQRTRLYRLPYSVQLDHVVDGWYRQGDSLYGLGVLQDGRTVSQIIQRSVRDANRKPRNVLTLVAADFNSHSEIDLSAERTGLFAGVDPSGGLVFTGHTRPNGERVRKFQLVP